MSTCQNCEKREATRKITILFHGRRKDADMEICEHCEGIIGFTLLGKTA